MRALVAAVAAAAIWAPAPAHAADPLVPPPTIKRASIAKIITATTARREPWDPATVTRLEPRARWGGGANQLLVLDSARVGAPGKQRLWLKVALPVRPNGTSGWIPADRAAIRRTSYRIHVDTGDRTVTLLRRGRAVRRWRAVVGAPSTPTPTGDFAVSEPIRQADPGAFLGPWALHLTAFSDVLEDFGGGPGRIGLHGRAGASLADPLGTARSHGCIRLDNTAISYLARVAQAGTPVRISAGGR